MFIQGAQRLRPGIGGHQAADWDSGLARSNIMAAPTGEVVETFIWLPHGDVANVLLNNMIRPPT